MPFRLGMRTAGLYFLFVALLSVGCLDSAPPAQERQIISADTAPEAIGPYSQAIQVGNQIYCSGQIGVDPATGSLVDGGSEAETRQALENLEAVLEAAGASLNDVVQAQVFLADLDDYSAMNEAYATYFDGAPPARAAVEAGDLPADAQVEIVVTAHK